MTFAGLPVCDKGKVATASLKEQADPECCIEGDEAQFSFPRASFRSWPLQIKVRGRWNAELPESKSSHGHEIGIRCLPYHLLRSTSGIDVRSADVPTVPALEWWTAGRQEI